MHAQVTLTENFGELWTCCSSDMLIVHRHMHIDTQTYVHVTILHCPAGATVNIIEQRIVRRNDMPPPRR